MTRLALRRRRSAEKSTALTAHVGANLTFHRHGELDEVGRTHQAAVGPVDELGVEGSFGFPEKDGGKRSIWCGGGFTPRLGEVNSPLRRRWRGKLAATMPMAR